jgi:hypothetical protein
MRKLLIFVLLFMLCVPAVLAIDPVASFTINRTGNIGAIPQTVIFRNRPGRFIQFSYYGKDRL